MTGRNPFRLDACLVLLVHVFMYVKLMSCLLVYVLSAVLWQMLQHMSNEGDDWLLKAHEPIGYPDPDYSAGGSWAKRHQVLLQHGPIWLIWLLTA